MNKILDYIKPEGIGYLIDRQSNKPKGSKLLVLYEDESYGDIITSDLDNFCDYADEDFTDECVHIVAVEYPYILDGLPQFKLPESVSTPYQTHLRAFLQGLEFGHGIHSNDAIYRFRTWWEQEFGTDYKNNLPVVRGVESVEVEIYDDCDYDDDQPNGGFDKSDWKYRKDKDNLLVINKVNYK